MQRRELIREVVQRDVQLAVGDVHVDALDEELDEVAALFGYEDRRTTSAPGEHEVAQLFTEQA